MTGAVAFILHLVARSVVTAAAGGNTVWLATSAPAQVDSLNADPVMLVTFGFGLLAEFAGTLVLAISFIRGRSGSKWIGWVLLASAVMLVLGDLLIAPGGPATNVAANLVSNLGPMLLMVALGALGDLSTVVDARRLARLARRHVSHSASGTP